MNEQAAMMNQQQQQQQLMNMNQTLLSMNQMNPQQPQPQMVPRNRSYGMWGQQQQFQNPNLNSGAMKPPPSAFNKSLGVRSNWKGKRVNKPNDKRRMELQQQSLVSSGGIAGPNVIGGGGGSSGSGGNLNFRSYNPPTLNELQHQNRVKARKFFPKKKFNKNNNMNLNMNMNMAGNGGRSAPYAPRNTTSFLIRAKKSGGIAPLVSPYPVTPSVLPTPILSPTTEVLGDMAKEEWGVDGYGSMKGLIRLRSHGHEMEVNDDEEEDEGGSSESDVEEHVEVERRLDHDLSRFEMIYDPSSANVGGVDYHNLLENRVDDQDTHIAQLEEENLILKERLFLMERELGDLRRRLLSLERRGGGVDDDIANEDVVENESENESESHGEETHSTGDNNEDFTGENNQEDRRGNEKGVDDGQFADGFEAEAAVTREKLQNDDEGNNIADTHNDNIIIDSKSADAKDEGISVGDEHNDNKDINGANKSTENSAARNVDAEPHKLVVESDICMIEREVGKEEKLGC